MESDTEFLARLGNAGAAHEEDFDRLFTLARRGAQATADDQRKKQPDPPDFSRQPGEWTGE